MKNKVLSLLSFALLSLVVLTGLASAVPALTLTIPPETLTPFDGSTTFTITATPNIDLTTTFPQTLIIKDSENKEVLLQINKADSNTANLTNLSSVIFNVNVISVASDFNLGSYSNSLTIAVKANLSTEVANISIPFSFENTPNEFPDNGHLKIDTISNNDITVKGFGEDASWYPLDEISVKVKVTNDGPKDVNNIAVSWGLYNKNTGNWVVDDEEKDFDLNRGDDKTVTVNFKLDDVEEFADGGNYVFYAWATGEDEEITSGEDRISTFVSKNVEIQNDKFVVLNDVKFSTETAACGEEVQVTADVWNIGGSDQNKVTVQILNTKLGINKEVTIGDINAYDKEILDFTFTVPSDIEAGSYSIKLSVYDEDGDIYQSNNDADSTTTSTLKVEGACVFNPKLSITAAVESGGKAGQELIVKATVKNIDTKTRTFTVNAAGFASWAELSEVSPQQLALDSGESTEVTVKLNVNKNVEGEQTFSIELVEGKNVIPQPVSVEIEKPKLFSFLTGNLIKGDNWYLWGIGALNILLVAIIIIVALRVAKKKE